MTGVPDDLAPLVAEALEQWLRRALLEERDGLRGRVPAHRVQLLVRVLRAAGSGAGECASAPGTSQPAEWLSTLDAAHLLGVTPQEVRRRCASGRLPARKVGRDWQIGREGIAG